MKKLLLFLICFSCIAVSFSQNVAAEMKRLGALKKKSLDSNGWKHDGVFTLNANQAALSDWSSGGESFLIGINAIFNQSLHHRFGKYTWDAYMDIELGVVEAASFKKFRKTNDRCDLTMELEHELTKKHLNYGILFNLNTQIFGGHNYYLDNHPKTSGIFSPGKLLLCAGLDYKLIGKSSYFSIFASPLTFRWVTKLEKDFYNRKMFGVDSARKVYTEVGADLSFHFNYMLTKTTKYIGRLDLITNYKRNPQNVDVLWNNLLTFAISKNFAGSFLLDILYDDDVKRRTQIQEITGIGLKFTL
jgi:hypothetical protein